MIEAFLAASTWEDLVRYTVIAVVLAALSPYGIFILRVLFAMATGTPRPHIVKRRAGSARDAIADLERVATPRLEEMTAYIGELQENLEEASREAEQLRHENEALKAHIRGMDETSGSRRSSQDHASHESAGGTPRSDYATLGLPDNPAPSWEQIRAAFRDLAKVHHPDRGGDPEQFRAIASAYERLRAHRKPSGR